MKRFCDLVFSAFCLLALAVPILILMVLVWIKLGRPIFFKQTRPGLNCQPFLMYKFRTMTNKRDMDGKLLSDVERLTPFGCFLRSTSLDELPELWNVLRGDMSLIGPRPLLMEYLPLYSTKQALRHSVLPGITGWAQVNGRNALCWEEKLRMDVWYVDHQSFFLDLRIFLITIWKVILRDGISAAGEATMTPFQ